MFLFSLLLVFVFEHDALTSLDITYFGDFFIEFTYPMIKIGDFAKQGKDISMHLRSDPILTSMIDHISLWYLSELLELVPLGSI